MNSSTKSTENKQRLITTARLTGSPKDQARNFFNSQYFPLRWQWKFHAAARKSDNRQEAVYIGVGGARGPGKSHAVFAQITLDDCQRIPGLKALFLRQTGTAAQESFEDLVVKVLQGVIDYRYDRSKNVLHFPNGSRVVLGGFKDQADIDKYIGIEYDLMGVEELNQLIKDKVDKLLGSLRTSKPNWRPRLYASFNPGGVGHSLVKDMFVKPYREGRETKTKFISSTYKSNPYLNEEYVDYLENLAGSLGKAWREGDFDSFEGQFFSEWDFNVHCVNQIFLMPTWKKYVTFDYGSTNPFAAYWVAIDYDGNAWAYREYWMKGKNADENAREIMRLSVDDPINPETGNQYECVVAPMDIFAKSGQPMTIAEIIEKEGLKLTPSGGQTRGSRVAKAALMHTYLEHKNKLPKLRFFSPLCPMAIETIPALIHSKTNPEDVDTTGNDHGYDAIIQLLAYLHAPKTALPVKPQSELEKKLSMFKQNQVEEDSFFV